MRTLRNRPIAVMTADQIMVARACRDCFLESRPVSALMTFLSLVEAKEAAAAQSLIEQSTVFVNCIGFRQTDHGKMIVSYRVEDEESEYTAAIYANGERFYY